MNNETFKFGIFFGSLLRRDMSIKCIHLIYSNRPLKNKSPCEILFSVFFNCTRESGDYKMSTSGFRHHELRIIFIAAFRNEVKYVQNSIYICSIAANYAIIFMCFEQQ